MGGGFRQIFRNFPFHGKRLSVFPKKSRKNLEKLAAKKGLEFAAPPIRLCTDNGVMIAWAGLERFQKGYTDDLSFKPRPRWPLDENAPKAAGAGGVKA